MSPFLIAGASLALIATKLFPSLLVVLAMPSATLVLVLLPYIVLGWPALYFSSKRRAPSLLSWVIVGFLVGLVSPVIIVLQNALIAGYVDRVLVTTAVEIGLSMGLIMIPIWSGFAAVLYRIFTMGRTKTDRET